jgi:hypothetical protein
VILAELEVYHSRPIAPTRRVALGHTALPVDPPPGLGGILLGGVVAANIAAIDTDHLPDLARLMTELEHGMRIPQPRLRYRYQRDRVGLQRSVMRLVGDDLGPSATTDDIHFDFRESKAAPEQLVLAAIYAAGELTPSVRPAVMSTLQRAIRWEGPIGADLISSLAGMSKGKEFSAFAFEHPVEWALGVLGFASPAPDGAARNGSPSRNGTPDRAAIRARFRELLREAHPDHGAEAEGAARRIADLAEARRILMTRPTVRTR